MLAAADSRLVDILDLLKLMNRNPLAHHIHTLTLLCGLLIFVASLFALQATASSMAVLQIVVFAGWIAISALMISAVRRWTVWSERQVHSLRF